MRVKIYQIDTLRDMQNRKFMASKDEPIDPSIYEGVFNAVIDDDNPYAIYERFNNEGHPLVRGHSLSISDVIVLKDKAYICEPVGFKEIEFDESKTQKQKNLMQVVYKEPKKPAFVTEIRYNLDSMQKAVGGGLIETVKISNDQTILVSNEESKLLGMEGNIRFGDGSSIIAGPFFICGENGCDFRGLTDAETLKYLEKYKVPEDISQEEVQSDMGIQVFGFNHF